MKKILLLFILLISSVFFAQNSPPNDCAYALSICGNTPITINGNGAGTQELLGGSTCGGSAAESNSVWLKVTIKTSGTFTFTIEPFSSDINIDIDFWIFGPNVSCGNLGTSIRCSTTNPAAANSVSNTTGLSLTATDFSEGPGPSGDNFVKYMDVLEGETYYICVNLFSGNSDFNLVFGGTATMENPFQNVSFNEPQVTSYCSSSGALDLQSFTNNILGNNNAFLVQYYDNVDDAYLNNNPITSPIPITQEVYYYRIYNAQSPCFIIGEIHFNINPAPAFLNTNFSYCKNMITNEVNISLSSLTSQAVSNADSFNIKYYQTLQEANNQSNPLPENYTFSTNQSIYMRVEIQNCDDVIKEIQLNITPQIALNQNEVSKTICDNTLSGVSINLQNYISDFITNNNGVTTNFYTSKTDAQNAVNSINSTVFINNSTPFYYRFKQENKCDQIGILNIVIKKPKKSEILSDKVICEDATTSLDAGTGFDAYLWSNGETSPVITGVGTGNYYVDLSFNGCVYRQNVKIIAAENPVITAITIQGNNAEISVSGGNAPYFYSLDGITYQSSSSFLNLPKGIHKVFVKSNDDCAPVVKKFLILNLINVITPNDDGYNDVLDYSDLGIKTEVRLEIYDRYGTLVHKNDGRNFVWDGKNNGRVLSTGTYWYLIQWKEPDFGNVVTYTGWILLKNRNKKE